MLAVRENYDIEPWRRIRSFMYTYPWDCMSHWHETLELVYVCKGRQPVGVDDTTIVLQEGEMLLIPPERTHAYLPHNEEYTIFVSVIDPAIWESIGFSPEERAAYREFFWEAQILSFAPDDPLSPNYRRLLETEMTRQIREFSERQDGFQLAVEYLTLRMFVLMRRHMIRRPIERPHTTTLPMRERLDKILNYVAEHYREAITLEDILKVVNLNKSYFCRFFKETMGLSFLEYVHLYRLKQAEWMLLKTDARVSEISREVGFSSVDHFNRLFRRQYHCTPSQFRRERGGTQA